MITRIEALQYRCLRYVEQDLDPFHVLVGPNASGKTTFLDVIAFLGGLVSQSLEETIAERTESFQDLVWARKRDRFELAIEAKIPGEKRRQIEREEFNTIRYEVSIGYLPHSEEIGFLGEKVLLEKRQEADRNPGQRDMFPRTRTPPETILTSPRPGRKTIVNKVQDGNDNFYDETGKGWDHAFKLGAQRSALANLPEDESKFPVSTWLKGILSRGINRFMLNSLALRKASAPVYRRGFRPDGSNLPWVIHRIEDQNEPLIKEWVKHLQTALPDLEAIRTVERPDDKHRYLVLRYRGGLEIPSWVASDGTLRLLALTLPAYLPGLSGIYLIEEPENGIHPRAVEALFNSLSSVYEAQILLATHSPVILSIADPASVLCFARSETGGTDIVRGPEHPALRDWQGETNFGTLFASGVLGG